LVGCTGKVIPSGQVFEIQGLTGNTNSPDKRNINISLCTANGEKYNNWISNNLD
jgi:hypothetical protein